MMLSKKTLGTFTIHYIRSVPESYMKISLAVQTTLKLRRPRMINIIVFSISESSNYAKDLFN